MKAQAKPSFPILSAFSDLCKVVDGTLGACGRARCSTPKREFQIHKSVILEMLSIPQ
jgi:hypothetical protein